MACIRWTTRKHRWFELVEASSLQFSALLLWLRSLRNIHISTSNHCICYFYCWYLIYRLPHLHLSFHFLLSLPRFNRGTETWNRLTAVGGGGGTEEGLKEGGRSSRRTYRQDLWTCTVAWGFPEAGEGVLGGGGQSGKNWDNCSSINNKMYFKKWFSCSTTSEKVLLAFLCLSHWARGPSLGFRSTLPMLLLAPMVQYYNCITIIYLGVLFCITLWALWGQGLLLSFHPVPSRVPGGGQ